MPNIDTNIIFSRKHPFYTENEGVWQRCKAAYGGGGKYIKQALVRHISEIGPEFTERMARAYYHNYPRSISRMIVQCVLSNRPCREGADAEIEEDFSRTGLRVDEVMRQFCAFLNVYGCAWLAVDMPSFDGYKTKMDEIAERLRPYCVALNPLQVVDWCYGSDGQLLWVIVREDRLDNSDPFATAANIEVRKLWTRADVTTIAYNQKTGVKTVTTVQHGLGAVPFVRHVEIDGYGIGENHWFEDVVRISDAILNAGSEAQMNTVKQMFGLLVIPEDFMDNVRQQKQMQDKKPGGESEEPLSYTLARSAALYESAEAKGCCRYISPSGTETATIRSEIDAMRKELYNVVGLATSKDTRLVESAEAKAWDYQNMEHYMATRADVLEQCEIRAWQLLNKWMPTIPVPKVSYNRNFAILDLKESVAALLELSGFNQQNDDYQREIGKTALMMLNRLRQLPQAVQERIIEAIEKSTPGADAAEIAAMVREMRNMPSGQDDGGQNANVDNSGNDE